MGYDIVGADDDAGYDDEAGGMDIVGAVQDMVGAAGKRRILGGRGARVVRTSPDQLQKLVMGLGSTSLLTLTTATITLNPQRPMRIERLTLFSSATGIVIDDIRVGAESQFISAGNSVPWEVWGPTAVDTTLRGATAVPGITITIAVRNPTGGTLAISGALIGMALV